ncbi:MAG: nickel ABC transporter permease [Terriglobia bacterium]
MKTLLIPAARYFAARLVYALPVVFLAVSLVFFLIHLVPGDPVQQMLGERARAADVERTRRELGLDQPLLTQYGRYLSRLVRGDLGYSLRFNAPVTEIILARYPATIELTLAALIVALLLSIPAGVQAAVHRGHWPDSALGFFSLLGLSFPNFALGPVLILVFSVEIGWLPVSGSGTLLHLILPAVTLGAALAAILTRMVRTSVLEELGQDYVRTARAKGLAERRVRYKHVLRNSLIPVVTLLGLQLGALLSGAMVTETIFSWPGIGRLTLQAINSRDYPLVQGCFLAISVTYILVNLVTDLCYSVVDPRIRET